MEFRSAPGAAHPIRCVLTTGAAERIHAEIVSSRISSFDQRPDSIRYAATQCSPVFEHSLTAVTIDDLQFDARRPASITDRQRRHRNIGDRFLREAGIIGRNGRSLPTRMKSFPSACVLTKGIMRASPWGGKSRPLLPVSPALSQEPLIVPE
jgi:hypothetical protein